MKCLGINPCQIEIDGVSRQRIWMTGWRGWSVSQQLHLYEAGEVLADVSYNVPGWERFGGPLLQPACGEPWLWNGRGRSHFLKSAWQLSWNHCPHHQKCGKHYCPCFIWRRYLRESSSWWPWLSWISCSTFGTSSIMSIPPLSEQIDIPKPDLLSWNFSDIKRNNRGLWSRNEIINTIELIPIGYSERNHQ